MNTYENAPATKLLATHCACCARPLLDAESAEVGMGPVCRKNNGYSEVAAMPEETRAEANRLINLIARERASAEVVAAFKRLFELGLVKIVEHLLASVATVKIAVTGEDHPHGAGRLALKSPYSEIGVNAIRAVPGRRWDAENKLNTFPESSRSALFECLKVVWPGVLGIGPKGPFMVPTTGGNPVF